MARDEYNREILELAETCDSPGEWYDPDDELIAQIALVRELLDTPAADHAVDHLRVMLEISYLDASDLPTEVPAARGEAPQAAPGSPQEVFEFPVRLTRTQLDWVTSALASMENNGPTGESRAASVLMGQIPDAYYQH